MKRALAVVAIGSCCACSIISGLEELSVDEGSTTSAGGTGGTGGGEGGTPDHPCQACGDAIMWFEADAIPAMVDGAAVPQWLDQSGNGNDAQQTDLARQPVYRARVKNGQPGLFFDGTDDVLGFVGTEVVNQVSVFLVYRLEAGATAPGAYAPFFLGDDSGVTGAVYGIEMLAPYSGASPDVLDVLAGAGNDARATLVGISAFDQWKLMSIVTTGPIISTTTVRVNGADALMGMESALSMDIPIQVMIGLSSGLGYGGVGGAAAPGLVYHARCTVAALLVFRFGLPDTSRSAIEGYLADKYALPI